MPNIHIKWLQFVLLGFNDKNFHVGTFYNRSISISFVWKRQLVFYGNLCPISQYLNWREKVPKIHLKWMKLWWNWNLTVVFWRSVMKASNVPPLTKRTWRAFLSWQASISFIVSVRMKYTQLIKFQKRT